MKRGRLFADELPTPELVSRGERTASSRYELLVKIGSGGSASVYVGRATGNAGFSRLVAVKRPRAAFAHDAMIQQMMATEARLASQLNHSNVVAVQDVEEVNDELLLILDYVEGASLAELIELGVRSGVDLPAPVALRIALDACAGLAAAHDFEGADGHAAGFLHRNLSPQNILIGVDGTSRLTDFGLAKHRAACMTGATRTLKGKLAYLAPEVFDKGEFTVQTDVFALGVVIWEALAKKRLFRGESWADTVRRIGREDPPALSTVAPGLGTAFDEVVGKALDRVAARRHATMREFGDALERAARQEGLIATPSEVSRHVKAVVGELLQRRRELIRDAMAGKTAPDASGSALATAGGSGADKQRPVKASSAPSQAQAAAVGSAGVVDFSGGGDDEETLPDMTGVLRPPTGTSASQRKLPALRRPGSSAEPKSATAAAVPQPAPDASATPLPAPAPVLASLVDTCDEDTCSDTAETRIISARAKRNEAKSREAKAEEQEAKAEAEVAADAKGLRPHEPTESLHISCPPTACAKESEPQADGRDEAKPRVADLEDGARVILKAAIEPSADAPPKREVPPLPRIPTPLPLPVRRTRPRTPKVVVARKIAGLVVFSAAVAAIVLVALILAAPPPAAKRAAAPAAPAAAASLR